MADRKERLLETAADCQRQNGMIPETREIDAFWSRELEEADRRKAESPPPPPSQRELEPRTADEHLRETGAKMLSQGQIAAHKAKAAQRAKKQKTPLARCASARLRLLKRSPSWHREIVAAINRAGERAGKHEGGTIAHEGQQVSPYRVYLWDEVRKVLDASDAAFSHLFGRWDDPRDKRPRIYV